MICKKTIDSIAMAALWIALLLLPCACGEREQTKSGQEEIVFKIGAPMTVRNANMIADAGYHTLAMLLTHDTLVRFDEDLNPIPQLARSWKCNANATQWTFTMDPAAKWHDGVPVTAQDIKFTFDYVSGSRMSGYWWIKDLVREIEIRGSDIIFTLTKPYSRFLINGGYIVRILPKHIWENITEPKAVRGDNLSTGSGPFMFDALDANANFVSFKKNPSYHGVVPKVDRIEFRLFKNMDALALALARGKVDAYYKYASGFPVGAAAGFANDENIIVERTPSLGVPTALGFNPDTTLGGSPIFRKAVSLAIDYSRMNDSLFMGTGRIPTGGFVPPSFPYFVELPVLKTDPEKSRKLLAAMGLEDIDGDGILEDEKGEDLTVQILSRSDLRESLLAVKLLTHDLKNIGVKVKPFIADLSAWIARLDSDQFDLALFRATPWGMMMGAGCATGYFDSRRKGGGRLSSINDPDFYQICDAMLETVDPEKLNMLREKVQRYYAEHLPALALCWSENLYPHAAGWSGFTIHQMEGGIANRLTWKRLHKTESGRKKAS